MSALSEHLAKLNRLADGALNTISREEGPKKINPVYTDAERRQNWWDGYRQAVADITDFVIKQEDAP